MKPLDPELLSWCVLSADLDENYWHLIEVPENETPRRTLCGARLPTDTGLFIDHFAPLPTGPTGGFDECAACIRGLWGRGTASRPLRDSVEVPPAVAAQVASARAHNPPPCGVLGCLKWSAMVGRCYGLGPCKGPKGLPS